MIVLELYIRYLHTVGQFNSLTVIWLFSQFGHQLVFQITVHKTHGFLLLFFIFVHSKTNPFQFFKKSMRLFSELCLIMLGLFMLSNKLFIVNALQGVSFLHEGFPHHPSSEGPHFSKGNSFSSFAGLPSQVGSPQTRERARGDHS